MLTLQDPVTATPFTLFYSWGNSTRTSIQDLLEMGQDVAFYLVLDRLNKVEMNQKIAGSKSIPTEFSFFLNEKVQKG